MLRFGKSFEVFYGALKSIHHQDAWLAFTVTVTKICQSIFLLTDHIVWLSRSGLFKNIDTSKWTQRSNKYWLLSLVMSIVRDVYEINRVVASFSSYKNLSTCIASSLISVRGTRDVENCFKSVVGFLAAYKHITVDTIKNCCDLFIPMSSMGYVKLSPRVIGILGICSSIAGLLMIIDPSYKLSP